VVEHQAAALEMTFGKRLPDPRLPSIEPIEGAAELVLIDLAEADLLERAEDGGELRLGTESMYMAYVYHKENVKYIIFRIFTWVQTGAGIAYCGVNSVVWAKLKYEAPFRALFDRAGPAPSFAPIEPAMVPDMVGIPGVNRLYRLRG
ncbi:MAG: hypothetical protein ACR2QH_00150, partial [Geminicoccaceae bacterium]